jgi:hypothetical protein
MGAAALAKDSETELSVFRFCLWPFDTLAVWSDVSVHFHFCELTARVAHYLGGGCHEQIVGNRMFGK